MREAEAAREDAARLELIVMEQREASSQPPVDAFLVEVDEVDDNGGGELEEDEESDIDYDENNND